MLKSLTRASAALLVAVSFGFSVVPAAADQSQALATGVVSGANTAIRNAMDAKKAQPQPSPQTQQQDNLQPTVAQVPPVSQLPVGGPTQVGPPDRAHLFRRFLDRVSVGKHRHRQRQVAAGRRGRHARVRIQSDIARRRIVLPIAALSVRLQQWNRTASIYPPGFPQRAVSDLNGTTANGCGAQNLDLTTKDSFLLLSYEKLFILGVIKEKYPVPLVVTPTYVSRWSQINQSGQPEATSCRS